MNMKARKEENGQIKIYGVLPSKYKGVTGNYAGGFHLAEEDILKEEGFFDVVTPEYNRTLEILSEIYFDEGKQIYTYDVLPNPNLPSIEEAKINKIKELKYRAKEKFNETDWYYIRELHADKKGKNKKVPDLIVGEREIIYSLVELKELQIDSLTELEDVLNFDTSLEEPTEMEDLILEETLVEDEVLEESVEEPLLEELAEETLIEDSVVEGSIETPVEEPVVDVPVVEEPVVEDLTQEEPVVETPIEEPVITPVPIPEIQVEELIPEETTEKPIPEIFREEPPTEAPASNSIPIPEPSIEEDELNQFTV